MVICLPGQILTAASPCPSTVPSPCPYAVLEAVHQHRRNTHGQKDAPREEEESDCEGIQACDERGGEKKNGKMLVSEKRGLGGVLRRVKETRKRATVREYRPV